MMKMMALALLVLLPCCKETVPAPVITTSNSDAEVNRKATEERRQFEEAVLRLAKEKEVEAIQRREAILTELVDEHFRQVSGHKFEARRHGDFLTVFVTRNGNPVQPEHSSERYVSSLPERTFSTTLNLGKTVEIRLKSGNLADDGGELLYYWKIKRDGKEYGTMLLQQHRCSALSAAVNWRRARDRPWLSKGAL